ncbi:MAG: hypothetical protein HY951_02460, partial [Bacteroidia bacterium]|nr:hypothetical protein [Bacteroidia bacterium]
GGMLMPQRNWPGNSTVNGGYRFGFNGKEKEDEITGSTGSHLDFGARIYDSRIGRLLSMDPLANKVPSESPYNFAGNSPILYVDINGEIKWPTGKEGEDLAAKYPTAYKYLTQTSVSNKGTLMEMSNSDRIVSSMIANTHYANQKASGYSGYESYNNALTKGKIVDAFSPTGGPDLKIRPSVEINGAGGYTQNNAGSNYTSPIEIASELFQAIEDAETEDDKQAALLNLVSVVIHEIEECYSDDRINEGNARYGVYPMQEEIYGNPFELPGYPDYNNAAKNVIEIRKEGGSAPDPSVLPTLPK